MNELNPCPFCGGEATLDEIPPHTHMLATFMPEHHGSWTIECGCGVGLIDESKEAVISRWNTRAAVPVSAETAKKLARDLFARGSDDNDKVQRIEFKGGEWPSKETSLGGFCEGALVLFIHGWLIDQAREASDEKE